MGNRVFITAGSVAASVATPYGVVTAKSSALERVAAACQTVSDKDIARFWQAFDGINAAIDPAERLHLIQTIYTDPDTPGLHALMAARRYTAQQYVDAIVNWPRF